MSKWIFLVTFVICGCAAPSWELTPEEQSIRIYSEEPACVYEEVASFSSRSFREPDILRAYKKIISEAVELDATAVIIHSEGYRNESTAPVGTGGTVRRVYWVRATGINCLQ